MPFLRTTADEIVQATMQKLNKHYEHRGPLVLKLSWSNQE